MSKSNRGSYLDLELSILVKIFEIYLSRDPVLLKADMTIRMLHDDIEFMLSCNCYIVFSRYL
jgi:hypothetical protein